VWRADLFGATAAFALQEKLTAQLVSRKTDPGADEAVAELNGSNNVVSVFVYGAKPHVPEYMVKAGATYKLVSDHVGSVRLVVNVATGAVVQRLDSDEFGAVTANTNPGFQPFGFAGGLYDAETGFVRFGARDYDAVTGRWSAKDPILFRGGQSNLYAYVNNDPVTRTDPFGVSAFEWLLRLYDICKDVLGEAASALGISKATEAADEYRTAEQNYQKS